jgi:hypothetical protein
MRFEESEDLIISQIVLNFPQYLLYGVKTPLQLALIEVGFSDRIGIIELSNLISESGFEYLEIQQLKSYLRLNRIELLKVLQNKLPNISYDKTNESFRFISILNIN